MGMCFRAVFVKNAKKTLWHKANQIEIEENEQCEIAKENSIKVAFLPSEWQYPIKFEGIVKKIDALAH